MPGAGMNLLREQVAWKPAPGAYRKSSRGRAKRGHQEVAGKCVGCWGWGAGKSHFDFIVGLQLRPFGVWAHKLGGTGERKAHHHRPARALVLPLLLRAKPRQQLAGSPFPSPLKHVSSFICRRAHASLPSAAGYQKQQLEEGARRRRTGLTPCSGSCLAWHAPFGAGFVDLGFIESSPRQHVFPAQPK